MKRFKLKLFRMLAGYPQKNIAQAIGVSQQYISLVETGRRPPSKKFKEGFSKLLGIPEKKIFGEDTK